MLCRDEAYRCFGVGAGCAEAGESRGGRACPRRGHTVRQSSRAEGRFLGYFRHVTEVSAVSCRDVGNDFVAGSE